VHHDVRPSPRCRPVPAAGTCGNMSDDRAAKWFCRSLRRRLGKRRDVGISTRPIRAFGETKDCAEQYLCRHALNTQQAVEIPALAPLENPGASPRANPQIAQKAKRRRRGAPLGPLQNPPRKWLGPTIAASFGAILVKPCVRRGSVAARVPRTVCRGHSPGTDPDGTKPPSRVRLLGTYPSCIDDECPAAMRRRWRTLRSGVWLWEKGLGLRCLRQALEHSRIPVGSSSSNTPNVIDDGARLLGQLHTLGRLRALRCHRHHRRRSGLSFPLPRL